MGNLLYVLGKHTEDYFKQGLKAEPNVNLFLQENL